MTRKKARRHSGLPGPQAPDSIPLFGLDGDISVEEIQALEDKFVKAVWPDPAEEVSKCLETVEALAGMIYERHGLPSAAGDYQKVDGRWVLIKGPRDRALGRPFKLFSIGLAERGNREVLEAAELFKLAYYSRCELKEEQHYVGFIKGFQLAYRAGRWRQDWQLGEELRRGVSSVRGVTKASAHNDAKREKTESLHAEIRQMAQKLREGDPGLSDRKVAKEIKKSGEVSLSEETIRKALK